MSYPIHMADCNYTNALSSRHIPTTCVLVVLLDGSLGQRVLPLSLLVVLKSSLQAVLSSTVQGAMSAYIGARRQRLIEMRTDTSGNG